MSCLLESARQTQDCNPLGGGWWKCSTLYCTSCLPALRCIWILKVIKSATLVGRNMTSEHCTNPALHHSQLTDEARPVPWSCHASGMEPAGKKIVSHQCHSNLRPLGSEMCNCWRQQARKFARAAASLGFSIGRVIPGELSRIGIISLFLQKNASAMSRSAGFRDGQTTQQSSTFSCPVPT
jgi:hypothetical protein